MLLVSLTVNGVVKRISNESLNLEHHWYPYIESFSAPQIQMTHEYGGFARLGFGSISISPACFTSDWPPPLQCAITCQYTASTEAAAVTLFSSLAHLTGYSRDNVSYEIRELEYDRNLLLETLTLSSGAVITEDYSGNPLVLPRAFGTVTHATPVKIDDVDIGGSYGLAPTYYMAGLLSTSTAKRIIGFSYYDASNTKVHIGDIDGNALNHGWSNGTTIYIVNSTNFSGAHVINNASGSTFTIPVVFAQEPMPLYCSAHASGGIEIYDDGYPIPENFYDNGDGTFSLMDDPVGEVTMSGTAAYTTLTAVMQWAATYLGIGTYNNDYARSPSPPVSVYLTSQQPLIDFMADVCAANSHLFYIDYATDTLYLVDMYADNGTLQLTEFNFFEQVEYEKPAPTKKISTSWTTRASKEGFMSDDDVTTAVFVESYDHEVSVDVYQYGNDLTVNAYHDNEATLKSALVMIKSLLKWDHATIKLPFSTTLPVPGEKISWTDSSLPTDTPGYIRARTIEFDFDNDEVRISGDGIFLQSGQMVVRVIADTLTSVIDSFDQSVAAGAIWEIVIRDATLANMRSGWIGATWDQVDDSSPQTTLESSTSDIGDTSAVSITVDKSGSTVRLLYTSTGGDPWTITGRRRLICR